MLLQLKRESSLQGALPLRLSFSILGSDHNEWNSGRLGDPLETKIKQDGFAETQRNAS